MNRIVRPSAFSLRISAINSVDLRGRQHGGRLVEDQDVGAAIEQPQDLQDLRDVHRRVGDALPPIDRDARDRGQPLGLRSRRSPVDQAAAPIGSRARIRFSSNVSGGASMNS